MSKKVLNYAGQRPMLLAILVMATLALGLLFSGWLTPTSAKAQHAMASPQPKKENTNDCFTANATTTCSGGAVIFTNTTATPLTNCLYTGFSASTTEIKSSGSSIITYTCTNSSGQTCTNCSPPQTNEIWPNMIAQSWEVSGVSITVNGVNTTGGSGLFASFTPTSCGLGTVTFYETWQDGCSTNINTTSVATNFYARCPVMTVSSATAASGNKTGGYFQYCYDSAAGWYWSENVVFNFECGAGQTITSPTPKVMNGACVTDEITTGAAPDVILALNNSTSCTETRNQTIFVGPYPNQTVCSYINNQTIAILATDSTLAHGAVVTSVDGRSINCGDGSFTSAAIQRW